MKFKFKRGMKRGSINFNMSIHVYCLKRDRIEKEILYAD